MSKELIERLRKPIDYHTPEGAPMVLVHHYLQEAADTIERLEKERGDFYADYRMKCDVETKRLHEQLAEAHTRIDDLGTKVDQLQWENKGIAEWREIALAAQKRIDVLEYELKMERNLSFRNQVEGQQKRIELYEQALKASWPEGAIGDAFDYWNAARMEAK